MRLADTTPVQHTLQGDEEVFGQLVARYQHAVYGLAMHLVHNFADAQDVAQESFLKAYASLGTLRDPVGFAGWLMRITTNTCHTWLRNRREIPSSENLAAVYRVGTRRSQGKPGLNIHGE